MPSKDSPHPLAVPITSFGQIGYPVSDNIGTYLGVLYEGKLYETLASGYPGEAIILNLVETYAEIGHEIFWIKDETYREALEAFPHLAAHILQTDLSLSDLYYVSQIVEDFFDWEPEGDGPAHLASLNEPIGSLINLFHQDRYKNAIYAALADKSRSDFYELISMANWFYGEDAFELFFSFAEIQPVQALRNPYWMIEMNDDQRTRLITWARSHMSTELLSKTPFRTQEYSETVTSLLDRIIWKADDALKSVRDRQDFAIWGLCSADKFLAAKAAYLLEELPVSQWPAGSQDVVAALFEEMEPNWTTFKRQGKKGSYTKQKERLGDLLKKANCQNEPEPDA
ncbi:hypothetical protein [Hyphococcus luteus]|uniref:Uncharacterized protein n=1 Tax=Hyphococcus luteus TaxID=2058213 RepID=A0A2S7K713_9PROT|nr:hypothetical protein [Marinicaulis flavus]PQA88272.1 hypothetical protein CW354_08200 [Marinicaulis flavus]